MNGAQGRPEVVAEKPMLVRKVDEVMRTLQEVRGNLERISGSVHRVALAPPRPVPPEGSKGSPEKPNSLEMRLDDVQMSANELCREADYLASRLEKLV